MRACARLDKPKYDEERRSYAERREKPRETAAAQNEAEESAMSQRHGQRMKQQERDDERGKRWHEGRCENRRGTAKREIERGRCPRMGDG